MNRNAKSSRYKSNDLITGKRVAAFSKFNLTSDLAVYNYAACMGAARDGGFLDFGEFLLGCCRFFLGNANFLKLFLDFR